MSTEHLHAGGTLQTPPSTQAAHCNRTRHPGRPEAVARGALREVRRTLHSAQHPAQHPAPCTARCTWHVARCAIFRRIIVAMVDGQMLRRWRRLAAIAVVIYSVFLATAEFE